MHRSGFECDARYPAYARVMRFTVAQGTDLRKRLNLSRLARRSKLARSLLYSRAIAGHGDHAQEAP